jgi:hypothetical protein
MRADFSFGVELAAEVVLQPAAARRTRRRGRGRMGATF